MWNFGRRKNSEKTDRIAVRLDQIQNSLNHLVSDLRFNCRNQSGQPLRDILQLQTSLLAGLTSVRAYHDAPGATRAQHDCLGRELFSLCDRLKITWQATDLDDIAGPDDVARFGRIITALEGLGRYFTHTHEREPAMAG